MSEISSTREERIQRFAGLDDEDQHCALVWLELERNSDPERRVAAAELLSGGPLDEEAKNFLIERVLQYET